MAEGVHGNHATIYPALSPMLWTSIATGKRPGKHGIHGFSEPTEDGLSVRPVSNLGRKTKAFWNILNQHGKRSIVVGWWPSHPAEPIAGAMVSESFSVPHVERSRGAAAPGAVWPAREAEALAEMRVHPTEISGDILRLFAPDWDAGGPGEGQERARPGRNHRRDDEHPCRGDGPDGAAGVGLGRGLLYRDRSLLASLHALSTPARRSGKGRIASRAGSGLVVNAYRYHDVMLGRLHGAGRARSAR